jgi:hypothetical protein
MKCHWRRKTQQQQKGQWKKFDWKRRADDWGEEEIGQNRKLERMLIGRRNVVAQMFGKVPDCAAAVGKAVWQPFLA